MSDPDFSPTDGFANQPQDQGWPNHVVEVTQRSWFGRIRDSVAGALIGILLLFAGVFLLGWNEKQEFATLRGLDFGARVLVEAGAGRIDPALDGRLVHLTGTLSARSSARDPVFGAVNNDAIRLRRHVEMRQWKEETSSSTQKNLGGSSTTVTSYDYHQVWSDTPIDSAPFHVRGGHGNPPMTLRSTETNAPDAQIGPRKLDAAVLDRLTDFAPLPPPDGAAPGEAAWPEGWVPQNDALFRGRGGIDQPDIGDVRITFGAIGPGPISVIAAQRGDRLAEFPTPSGSSIAVATPGMVASGVMFNGEKSNAKILAWIFRIVSFAVILLGLLLMLKPLAVLVGVLPFLESIVNVAGFFAMFGVAALISLATVAAVHVALQPLLSAALLAAGILIAAACSRARRSRVV